MTEPTLAPLLLGLDIGSTHAKAGLFARERALALATRPMPLRRGSDGAASFHPEHVWNVVADAIREVLAAAEGRAVAAVGIASMAESGLLVDAAAGSPRTHLIPWFDAAAVPEADRLAVCDDPLARFAATGLRMNYKAGLAKIRSVITQRGGEVLKAARWLSTADFIVYRLTGLFQTDPTLAARTHAFDLRRGAWDEAWLNLLQISPALFPPVKPSGSVAGQVGAAAAEETGLAPGTPVAIAGHDHVVAAFATGAVRPGHVVDSMGTAESMLGALPPRALTSAEYESGLVFGPHVVPDMLYWMAALSSSGGSIEWLRTMLADPYVSYEHLLNLLARAPAGPSPILYFPYLTGAQAPEPDNRARGAFVSLRANHTASDLALAVLQGAAYEMERIRRAAEQVAGPIDTITAVGGGTRIGRWLKIKADVAGKPFIIYPHAEAASLGAALLAGIGAGVLPEWSATTERASEPNAASERIVQPDPVEHRLHVRLLDGPYTALQAPLRTASHNIARALREEEEVVQPALRPEDNAS